MVDEQTETNRLQGLLKLYFPQALRRLDPLRSPMAVAFLERWPTLPQLQQEDSTAIEKFFYQHGSRSRRWIESRLAEIRQAEPAIEDRAIIDPCVLVVQVLLGVVTALRQGIAQLQQACQQVFQTHPDAAIFDSFPGAGKVMAPRLLAAFGSQRDRWGSGLRAALRLAEEGSAFFGAVAELVTEDTKSARGIAETSGDLGRGFLVDEEGPQGLVLTLQGELGGEKEFLVGRGC